MSDEMLDEFLEDLKPRFNAATYDLLKNNCNHFSDELAQLLVGTGIPVRFLWHCHGSHGLNATHSLSAANALTPLCNTPNLLPAHGCQFLHPTRWFAMRAHAFARFIPRLDPSIDAADMSECGILRAGAHCLLARRGNEHALWALHAAHAAASPTGHTWQRYGYRFWQRASRVRVSGPQPCARRPGRSNRQRCGRGNAHPHCARPAGMLLHR